MSVCVWSGLCPTSDCPTWDSPDPTEPARVPLLLTPLARALSRWCCCCGRRARACAPTRACARCRVAQAPGQKLVVADPLGLVPAKRAQTAGAGCGYNAGSTAPASPDTAPAPAIACRCRRLYLIFHRSFFFGDRERTNDHCAWIR